MCATNYTSFPPAIVAVAGDIYGETEEGLRWSVNCKGGESNLGECTAEAEYGSSYDTAGVICQGASAQHVI